MVMDRPCAFFRWRWLASALFLTAAITYGQPAPQAPALDDTLRQIFQKRAYRLRTFGPARWLDEGRSYTTLEDPSGASPSEEDEAKGGERKRLTILFADIRNSTGLIDSLGDPEIGMRRLRPVLDLMKEAVVRYEGVVNKSQGDGIMAIFGAPQPHEDHAVRSPARFSQFYSALSAGCCRTPSSLCIDCIHASLFVPFSGFTSGYMQSKNSTGPSASLLSSLSTSRSYCWPSSYRCERLNLRRSRSTSPAFAAC